MGRLASGRRGFRPSEMAPVSPLDPLLVGLSPSNPNRHGRGSQYTGPGLHMACSHPDFSVAACQQYMAASCKESRCSTQRAGVFSNPSVDADEGMREGTVVDWGVSGTSLSLTSRQRPWPPERASHRARRSLPPSSRAGLSPCLPLGLLTCLPVPGTLRFPWTLLLLDYLRGIASSKLHYAPSTHPPYQTCRLP